MNPARKYTILVIIALAAILPYIQIHTLGFTNFDDPDYVTLNYRVRAGLTWDGFMWALTSLEYYNWHPLTWLSHMLDCQLFGLNAGAHHLVNVVFHAVNVILLFLVLRSLTGAGWRSVVVAALFAVHPLQVDTVA